MDSPIHRQAAVVALTARWRWWRRGLPRGYAIDNTGKASVRMPIYTNHAIDRMHERKFDRTLADQTFHQPDTTHSGKEPGTTEFTKRFGKEVVTIIGTQNDQHEWVIISAWIDPPRPGTADEKEQRQWRAYQKAGFWGKLWYRVRRKFGV